MFIQLKDEAVALCDVIAPPDHILQSAIGSSDGQVGNLTNRTLGSINAQVIRRCLNTDIFIFVPEVEASSYFSAIAAKATTLE